MVIHLYIKANNIHISPILFIKAFLGSQKANHQPSLINLQQSINLPWFRSFPFQTTNRSTINLQQSTIGSHPFHSKQTEFISLIWVYPGWSASSSSSLHPRWFWTSAFLGGGQRRPLICDLKKHHVGYFLVLGKSGSTKGKGIQVSLQSTHV